MTQKTFQVDHEGTHYPTDEQSRAALREVLKADGQRLTGSPEFFLVESVSSGPSKVRATFESEPVAAAKKSDAKPDKTTMTAGG